MLIQLIEGVYRLLWGDLLTLHLGKRVCEFSMLDDQRYILEQVQIGRASCRERVFGSV